MKSLQNLLFLLFLALTTALAAPVVSLDALLPRHETRILARQQGITQPVTFETVETTQTQVGTITETCKVTLTPSGDGSVREDKDCTYVVLPNGQSPSPPIDSGGISDTVIAAPSSIESTSGSAAPTATDQTTAPPSTDGQATTVTTTSAADATTTSAADATTTSAAGATTTSADASATTTTSESASTSTSASIDPNATTTTSDSASTSATSASGDPSTTSADASATTTTSDSVSTSSSIDPSATSSSAPATDTASTTPPLESVTDSESVSPSDSSSSAPTVSAVDDTSTETSAAADSSSTEAPPVTITSTLSDGSLTTFTTPPTAAQAQASAQQEQVPGRKLEVLPIGLGVFAGISVIALIVVGLVTYERTKYRKAFRQRKMAEAGANMGYGGMAERT